jgi:hypothetical protein
MLSLKTLTLATLLSLRASGQPLPDVPVEGTALVSWFESIDCTYVPGDPARSHRTSVLLLRKLID